MSSGHIEKGGDCSDTTIDRSYEPGTNILELELCCRELFGTHLSLESVEPDAIRDQLRLSIWPIYSFLGRCNEQAQLTRFSFCQHKRDITVGRGAEELGA